MARDPFHHPEALIRRVYAYVAYRIGDRPDAEDVTSNTFERAVRYRDSFDLCRGDAAAWLIGIAPNVAAAERSFRNAIGKDPGDWNVYFDLARATTGRVQLAALAAASRLNPRSPESAQFRRGLAAPPAITVGGGS
jgi:RNA polymerase sigma-70 factor, ECF subfamily